MTTYLLVPGMWIGAWAWRDITAGLRAAGHDVYPLTLTGVADRVHLLGPGVDMDTHVEDIVRLVEIEDLRDLVLVGHSYGGLPVSVAALRLRDRIRTMAYVDTGPLPEGVSQADLLGGAPPEGDAVPPRPWDPQADPQLLAGLDERALALLSARATDHPAASVRHKMPVRATSADLPTTLISCTMAVDEVAAMTAAGHPFYAGLTEAKVIGVPTGHWPMFSEPAALTEALLGL